ncbi:SEC-C metal-binding domain-containing protein [Bacillus sp. CGMCC 1.16607]|uniref:SEC-C metal-binding domain-containing protein n=1 Tax=Bacillus sp. CGMCC 1.16607 TaxID=3351842 RepID=UPI00363DF555
MNFLVKIEPFLLSDDLFAQKFILHILDDFTFVPAEWTEMLLNEALHSSKKESLILGHLNKLPLSERAVQMIIEGLQKRDQTNKYLYADLLQNLEPEMALKYRNEIEPYIKKEGIDFYHFLQNGTEEEIWDKYGEILAQLENEVKFNHTLYSRAKLLARTLLKNGSIAENEIDLNLQEQLESEYFGFDGILIIYLIGLMKLPKYIPLLASLLDRDEDILLEEIADTLISFQSDEVVEYVLPYAKKEESSVFALSILSGTKTPLATKVLKELMNEVENEDDLSLVFEGLCQQLSTEALPEIEQYLKNDPESYMIEIEETAYGFYKVMGLKHRNLKLWKQIAEENEYQFRKHIEKDKKLSTGKPVLNNDKVGRNEPCPCGSGKKFKKCCGA